MVDKRKTSRKTDRDGFLPMGRRVMDVAYLRDGHDIVHTGEALLLACLVHCKGKTVRGEKELEQVSKMLNDPNRRPRRNRN